MKCKLYSVLGEEANEVGMGVLRLLNGYDVKAGMIEDPPELDLGFGFTAGIEITASYDLLESDSNEPEINFVLIRDMRSYDFEFLSHRKSSLSRSELIQKLEFHMRSEESLNQQLGNSSIGIFYNSVEDCAEQILLKIINVGLRLNTSGESPKGRLNKNLNAVRSREAKEKVLSDSGFGVVGTIEALYWNVILSNGGQLWWHETDVFLSFSQHADDFIAWQLLGKPNGGMVVEVGAFDGIHLSNSFSLEQMGWDSICIEPNPKTFEWLEQQRPSAVNINKAIVSTPDIKEVDFYMEETGVLSGCAYDESDVKKRHENRGLEYQSPKTVKVKASTLDEILTENKVEPGQISIVSIDVEGFEMEVLSGFDLNRFRPKLFIIEANNEEERSRILSYFSKHDNYIFVGDNFQNLFVMEENSINRRTLRSVSFSNYIPAKQRHPGGERLCIQSVAPRFRKSIDFNRRAKYFGLF